MTDVTRTEVQEARGLVDKTILLALSFGLLGDKVKLDNERVRVDMDKDLLSAHKTILDSKELRAIRAFDAETRTWAQKQCVTPPRGFRAGFYFLPVASLKRVDEELARRKVVRAGLVNAFVKVYPTLIEAARERLRSNFDELDYVRPGRVRARFEFEVRYLSFSTPTALKAISMTLYEREEKKAQAELVSLAREAKTLLRSTVAGLVSHLHERLSPGADGKPKRFEHSTVGNLVDFLASWEERDVLGDRTLGTHVKRLRDALSGVEVKTLRSDEALRNAVAATLGQVKAELDKLVTTADRHIDLSDDEPVPPAPVEASASA